VNHLLEIRDLKKAFRAPDGEREAVLDIAEFTMAPGEQVALEGQSGSGKTTLLHLIAGILTPDSGRILLDAHDLTALSEARRDSFRAAHLGYVFQTFNLLQGYSALENVLLGMTFGPGPDPALARELLEQLGLAGRLHHRPSQLSAGQQQRVALARALANRPRLVLADEPTGNLDHQRSAEALAAMEQACRTRGTALLLVSHDREILARFSRRVELSQINRVSAPARRNES
jgi:putative ABC transport system ATP-binding protein